MRLNKVLVLSALTATTALILTGVPSCITPPAPDAPDSEWLAYEEALGHTAEATESWGSILAPLTGGISMIVAGGIAESLRRLGKRQGVGAVAKPIEIARDRKLEEELRAKGVNVIVFNKAEANMGHEELGVGSVIRASTSKPKD